MIAIAGAKGGCGKTTATLGLAEAFARAGVPSLAVDADRQLPSLHLAGGVEREPPLEAFDPEAGVNAVSQANPRVDSSGVVAAPSDVDAVDLRATLRQLDRSSVQVLVDCPPGAGADAADALAAADRAVVVTTDSRGGLESAERTAELARRLETPVAGLVLNRCTTPSREARAVLDVPVLAAVPEQSAPLTDPDVCAAYDRAVATLRGEQATQRRRGQRRIQTGVSAVDQSLAGGLPPGSVVALSGPEDRVERLLGELSAQRDTLYLTTNRSERGVKRAVGSPDSGETRVVGLDDDPVATATTRLGDLPEDGTVVVDAVDPLEAAGSGPYLDLLNDIAVRVGGTRGVAVLRCLDDGAGTDGRATTERFADTLLEL